MHKGVFDSEVFRVVKDSDGGRRRKRFFGGFMFFRDSIVGHGRRCGERGEKIRGRRRGENTGKAGKSMSKVYIRVNRDVLGAKRKYTCLYTCLGGEAGGGTGGGYIVGEGPVEKEGEKYRKNSGMGTRRV